MKHSKENNMKRIKGHLQKAVPAAAGLLLLGIVLFLGSGLRAASYYYHEEFTDAASATSAGWLNISGITNQGHPVGRDGLFNAVGTVYDLRIPEMPSIIGVSNGRLYLKGRPNNGEILYNNIWVGKAAQFLPSGTFSTNLRATAQNPIGFSILRLYAYIDADAEPQGQLQYQRSGLTLWMVQDSSTVVNEWDNYANFVYLTEQVSMNWSGALDTSRIGWYDGVEHFPLTNQVTNVFDYSNYDITKHNWPYNDEDNTTHYGHNYTGFTEPLANRNINAIVFRMTHDGEYVRYYMNPNPFETNAAPLNTAPNTFILIGKSRVTWNDNIKFLIGHETMHFWNETTDGEYDDFLIRSVCNTLKASIEPRSVVSDRSNTFTVTVVPSFSAKDSGIGEILIKKPDYITSSWDLNQIFVTNASSGTFSSLTKGAGSQPATTSQFVPSITPDGLLRILFKTDESDSGVIKNGSSNVTNIIVFKLLMPAAASSEGGDFKVYANLEKYPNWSYNMLNLPTTGPKLADPDAADTLKVKSYNQPYANAAVTASPAVINQGTVNEAETAISYELSTRNITGRPPISKAIIAFPTNFVVYQTNIKSMLIYNDAANITLSQSNSSNYITLNYSESAMPGEGGYDRITFTVFGTPQIAQDATNERFKFVSWVHADSVVGAELQATGTNSSFPDQHITVAAADPVAVAGIFPKSLKNADKTNTMTYSIRNNGTTYNKIYKSRIYYNTTYIDSISDISSSVAATVTSGANYIELAYGSPLGSGDENVITFKMVHKITNLVNPDTTVYFTAQADNRNGKGFQNISQNSSGWDVTFVPPDPRGESYVTPLYFYTSDVTNQISFRIYNAGPAGDKIWQARIYIPDLFTNFAAAPVTSSYLSLGTSIVKTNISGTNYLWIKYLSESTNIGSMNDQVGVFPFDTVTVNLAKGIQSATNRISFKIWVDNRTNASFITNFASTNMTGVFSTNRQYMNLEFPPVYGAFDVQSRFTNDYGGSPVAQFDKLDVTTVSNYIQVRITNNGQPGNNIRKVRIELPSDVFTNIIAASKKSLVVNPSYINFSNSQIIIDYDAAVPSTYLAAGQGDTISFIALDKKIDSGAANFKVYLKNDREEVRLTNFIPGLYTDSLTMIVPPAQASGKIEPKVFFTTSGTNETDVFVYSITNTGGGSNKLTKVTIQIPALFQSHIVSVSNLFDTANSSVTTNATEITVNYTNQLDPGETDKLYIHVRHNYQSDSLANVTWEMTADNNGSFGDATGIISGGSKTQYATVRPYFNVFETGENDHNVYSVNSTNTINIKYYNGTNIGGQKLYRVKLTVPEPFVMPYLFASASQGSPVVTYNGRDVIVTYSSPLNAYSFDTLRLTVTDSFDESETNTSWQMQADYGDGIWRDMFSNGTIEGVVFTNRLAVVLPDAQAEAYLEPNTVFVNNISQQYSITVKNTGIYGNTLRLIEIRPPAFITNMISFSNTAGPITNWKHPSTNIWFVQYTASKLAVNSNDVIYFTGYDNATTASGSDEQWFVLVGNSTNTNRTVNAPNAYGKTLTSYLTLPSYRTEYYATPTSVDTTTASNTYTLYINNKSPQIDQNDSNIKTVRIILTNGFFLTNNLRVQSQKTGLYTVSQSGSNITITVDYSTNKIQPKSSDTLAVTILDSLTNGSGTAFWNMSVMYDTTEGTYNEALIVDGTNRIAFAMPAPQVNASWIVSDLYTTTTNADLTLKLSNSGNASHLLTSTKVVFPAAWNNRLYDIRLTNVSDTFVYNGTNIVVFHSNFTGSGIRYLQLKVSNSSATAQQLAVTAAVSNIYSSTSIAVPVSLKEPPSVELSPASVNTGVSSTNISIKIRNFSSSGFPVKSVRIEFPPIFTNVSAAASSFDGSASFTNNGNSWFVVYNTPLPQSGTDTLSFSVADNLDSGDTNFTWRVFADNGTGYADLSEYSTGTLTQQYLEVAPSVSYGFVYNEMFTTSINTPLVIDITNTGVGVSFVNKLSLTVPLVWQGKLSGVNSSLGNASITNNRVVIDYTNFSAGKKDSLSFTLSNTVTAPTNLSFVLYASNLIRGTAASPADQNAAVLKVVPALKAGLDLTQIDTSSSSNRVVLSIENLGNGVKPVKMIRIDIPGIYNTVYRIISSAGAVITNAANSYYLVYAAGLQQGQTDTVTVDLQDSLVSGNSNVAWTVSADNGTGEAPVSAKTTGALLQAFQMPQPAVKADFVYNETYTTSADFELQLKVTNKGTGSNLLKNLVITVPTDYIGGLYGFSSTKTAQLQLIGNELLVNYTNIQAVLNDTVTLQFSNTVTSVTDYAFIVTASNQSTGAVAQSDVNGSRLFVTTPPTGSLEPQSIYTTVATNQIQLRINNNSSGGLPVLKAQLTIPSVFSSIISAASSKLGTISLTNGNIISLDYSQNPLSQGSADTVTFQLVDAITYGTTNVYWDCRIDNGTGWQLLKPDTTGALTNSFVMPAAAAAGWLGNNWIYAASTSSEKRTNQLSVAFTNNGTGSNNLYAIKLTIPEVLSNISSIVSSKGGAVQLLNGTNLIVSYTNSLLVPGERDTVSFQVIHNVDIERSCQFGFYADNGDHNGFVKIGIPSGSSDLQQRLDIVMAEEPPVCYIAGAKPVYMWQTVTNRTIYTMDNMAIVSLVVKNRSTKYKMTGLVLQLTNMYTVTNVKADSRTVVYAHTNNVLAVDFSTPLGTQQTETLTLYAVYDSTAQAAWIAGNGSITNNLQPKVLFEGSPEYKDADVESRGALVLANATFGRYIGTVSPKDSGATVTLKYTSTDSLATNINGSAFSATINTNTGVYVVDNIPPGTDYSLIILPPSLETVTNTSGTVYSPVSYKTKIVSGMGAVANQISTITNLQLIYDRLNYQALGTQVITCQDDPLIQAVFPPGSLFQGMELNIGLEVQSAAMLNALTASGIKPAGSPSTLSNVSFTIKDQTDTAISENGLKSDVELVFHYDENNILSQGWSENQLAVYYWKPSVSQWVKVGGLIDTSSNTLRVKVSYLHAKYAVMAPAQQSVKAIRDVKASPNPFTPGRGGDQFSKVKLSFTFSKAYPEYQVKIFDMRGRLIRKFVRDGSYAQGEVFWDGLNQDGFNVPGGVYLYQIYAGSNVFTGTILVLK